MPQGRPKSIVETPHEIHYDIQEQMENAAAQIEKAGQLLRKAVKRHRELGKVLPQTPTAPPTP